MFYIKEVHVLTIWFLLYLKPIKCDENTTDYTTTDNTHADTDTSSDNGNGLDTYYWNKVSTSNETWMTLDPSDRNEEVHLENDKQLKVAIINLGNEGHKIIHGGGYHDEFQIDSCNGLLAGELIGGFGYNRIAVGYDCYKGKIINLLVMKDVRILTIGQNVNLVFRGIRHLKFSELSLDFDESENWNLTFSLASEYENETWAKIESPEASGDIVAALCGNYSLGPETRILCATGWQRTWIWISLICFCVSFCLFVCLMAFLCVRNKDNADFEVKSVEGHWITVSKL